MGPNNIQAFLETGYSLPSELKIAAFLSQVIFYFLSVLTAQRALRQWRSQKRIETVIRAFTITSHFKLLVDTSFDVANELHRKIIEDIDKKTPRNKSSLGRYNLGIQKLALATKECEKLVYQLQTDVLPLVEIVLGNEAVAVVAGITASFKKLSLPDEALSTTDIESEINQRKNWAYLSELERACSKENKLIKTTLLEEIRYLSQRADVIKAKLLEYTKG